MSEWSDKAIGDLGTVVTGSTPPSRHPDWFGNEVPFVTPSDMNEGDRRPSPGRCLSRLGRVGLKTRIVPANAVAFVCIGATIGKVCLLPTESVTNQQINTIVPNSDTDSRFLYYLLRYAAQGIAQGASGAATPIINKSVFASVVVRVPDLATQVGIGQVLGSFDDLIENNRRRVEVLEEMARAIYREWFVKFRYPGHSDVPLIDSSLGPIPENWEIRPIADVAEIKYGVGLSRKDLRDGDVPVYGAAKVIGVHDTPTVLERTIVMGCRGSCGQVAITEDRAFVTNNSFTITLKPEYGQLWLYRFLEHRGVSEFIGGSAQPQITLTSIAGLDVPIATRETRETYENAVRPLADNVWRLQGLIAKLVETRDLLLPKLVTGQFDVTTFDLDALIEEGAV